MLLSVASFMRNERLFILVLRLLVLSVAWLPLASFGQAADGYRWPHAAEAATVAGRLASPPGFERIAVVPGSFAEWLRGLPLKPAGSPVLLFNGEKKADQSVHVAVLDIDTGTRDLQQCADAVIRLRAEYLYAQAKPESIRFHFTSGDLAAYSQWRDGFRPEVAGNKVRWVKKGKPDASYAGFRKYLDSVFMYAGSQSLERELQPRRLRGEIQPGDVFVHGGSPGHAVLVVDVARNAKTGEMAFLLAQGYMPAQQIHILKNPDDRTSSPWYLVKPGERLRTPEWEFAWTELRQFVPATTH